MMRLSRGPRCATTTWRPTGAVRAGERHGRRSGWGYDDFAPFLQRPAGDFAGRDRDGTTDGLVGYEPRSDVAAGRFPKPFFLVDFSVTGL